MENKPYWEQPPQDEIYKIREYSMLTQNSSQLNRNIRRTSVSDLENKITEWEVRNLQSTNSTGNEENEITESPIMDLAQSSHFNGQFGVVKKVRGPGPAQTPTPTPTPNNSRADLCEEMESCEISKIPMNKRYDRAEKLNKIHDIKMAKVNEIDKKTHVNTLPAGYVPSTRRNATAQSSRLSDTRSNGIATDASPSTSYYQKALTKENWYV